MPTTFFRSLVILFLATAFLGGCQSPEKKAEKQKKEDEIYKIRDDMKDASFQSFLGRLRRAVAARDVPTMSSMMTNDFGYSWVDGSDGFGCFQYWTENNLWPELSAVIKEDFTPYNGYLVAPKEYVEMGEDYGGFRAGIRREKGSFKFAYFVPPKDADIAPPHLPGN